MQTIVRREHVDSHRQVILKDLPEELGQDVIIYVLPAHTGQGLDSSKDWKMFGLFSMFGAKDDEGVDWEEHFGLRDR